VITTAGLHPFKPRGSGRQAHRYRGGCGNLEVMSTWFRKRLIVRFQTTLFSFERPRSLLTRLFQFVEHGSARTLKSA